MGCLLAAGGCCVSCISIEPHMNTSRGTQGFGRQLSSTCFCLSINKNQLFKVTVACHCQEMPPCFEKLVRDLKLQIGLKVSKANEAGRFLRPAMFTQESMLEISRGGTSTVNSLKI